MSEQTKQLNPLSAIKAHCRECSGGIIDEHKNCPVTTCFLHPYRMGTNPFRKKRVMTDEQKTKIAERLKNARSKRG